MDGWMEYRSEQNGKMSLMSLLMPLITSVGGHEISDIYHQNQHLSLRLAG